MVLSSGLKVDQMLDVVDKDLTALDEIDETEQKKYSPEKFIGATLALQLVCSSQFSETMLMIQVGKHSRDEETVAAAQVLENIIAK